MIMLSTTKTTTAVGSSNQNINTGFKASHSQEIQSFCQLQIEHLIARDSVFWSRIVYHDAYIKSHEKVTNYTHNIERETLAYLNSEEWLTEYYPAFTLNKISLAHLTRSHCYVCPIGYRNQKPEYILLLANEPVCPTVQQDMKQSAIILSKYLDMYTECERQQAEIQLLEHVVQRAGHQLRNPLATIGLYAENLYLSLPSGSWQEQAAVIRETVQHLDTNLTELIYCGQGTKLKVTLQDLRTLVAESIQGLNPFIQQKKLRVCYPDTTTTLAMDRLQMKQVFDNLLSNAVHFSPESGIINCSWQVFQGEILIRIVDEGPGLSTDDLKKIFTPFYSRRSGGTGLGLTIAKKIVLDHQGSLWAQNSPHGGAQFYLSLPRNSIPPRPTD